MKLPAILLTGLFLAMTMAGCGGKATTSVDTTTLPALAEGKGAINGLVIDDRYRPVPDALILLTPVGLTATADSEGQFTFTDLDPGAYLALAQARDHEAAPKPVDIVAGEYTELEIQARRTFNDNGTILTTEYSVFIDCSFETPVLAGTGVGCMGDQSGDSDRTGFDTHLAPADANKTTYMITEVLYNKPADAPGQGGYGVVIGVLGAGNIYSTYYTESDMFSGTYQRMQNKAHAVNNRTNEDVGDRNVKWPPSKLFTTSIFPHGTGYDQIHNAPYPNGVPHPFGLGVSLGVKAKIVQTIFLGPPTVNVDTYAVLKTGP